MGARAEQLAKKFDESCREFTKVLEGLSAADWKKVTVAEKWPVGCVAHHVAGGQGRISGFLEMLAKGQPLPKLTRDNVNANNAKHAVEHANPDKAETLELFRANGAKASAIVRGLSDAELDRSGTVLTDIPAMTVQQAIEGILINHVQEHLGSIRATTGAK
jgi:DinB family protein